MLKGNKLGAHFRRQHIILDYIVDFICLDKGLIIELDGGYHDDPQQKEYDKARTAHLQRLGYTELRFKNEELLCNPDAVILKITDTLKTLPSLQGGVGGRLLPSLKGRAGDRLVGVIVGYITRERNALKQYFTRRAIIYGGPLLANDISDEALSALLGAVKNLPILNPSPKGRTLYPLKQSPFPLGEGRGEADPSLQGGGGGRLKPIYIETRNFNDYSRWKEIFNINGFGYQKHLDYHINTTSLELAQSNIGKHRWRYIRLSMRDGAQVVENPTIEQVQAFYTILQDLYCTKVRTPLWSWEFFEQLYRVEHTKYILVELDGKIVGGTVCVCLPGKAVYEWYACGLDNCRDDIRPLSVAIWGEMQYAAENGYPLFDFMGAGKPDEPYGVRDFKAEFGGELVEHGRFLCIRKPLLYKIGILGVKWLKKRK
jgi:very-short-patch-repair endonuclease